MIRLSYLLLAACLVGCSSGQLTNPPPTSAIATPAKWAFLHPSPVTEVINTTDHYFSASVQGDLESVLTHAVAGAVDAGWTEVSRNDVLNAKFVDLTLDDGALLVITVTPEGTSINLSANLVDPEK
ncbi:MAG: hypothetical protein ACI855_003440 [Myxococcota bacterium]|jgi:hypothetical protein